MGCEKLFVRLAAVGLVLSAVLGAQAAGSLADAKAKLAEAIANPDVMTATVKTLSAEDQKDFVSDVNTALGALPGKATDNTKTYAATFQALLKGADKKSLSTILAEIFAVIPVEVMPVLVENLAANVFDRNAASVTEEQFVQIAEAVTKRVADRTASADSGDVRTGFVAVMFAKASKGSPSNLSENLVKLLPEDAREVAAKSWLPEALKNNYEPMLTKAGVMDLFMTDIFSSELVLRQPAPEVLRALLADFYSGIPVMAARENPMMSVNPVNDLSGSHPNVVVPSNKESEDEPEPGPKPRPPEPPPYDGQS